MSGQIDTHMLEVRRLLKDRSPADYVFPTTQLEELTNLAIDELSEEMGMGNLETSAWVSLSVGVDTYAVTLPSLFGQAVPSIQHLHSLTTTNLNWPMQKLTREEMLDRKSGPSKRQGTPTTHYAIWEGPDQSLELMVDPYPTVADALNAIWQPIHRRVDSFYDSTLMFSKRGLSALRLRVCAMALATAGQEALKRLDFPSDLADKWRAESSGIALDEYARLNEGHRVGHIRRMR